MKDELQIGDLVEEFWDDARTTLECLVVDRRECYDMIVEKRKPCRGCSGKMFVVQPTNGEFEFTKCQPSRRRVGYEPS